MTGSGTPKRTTCGSARMATKPADEPMVQLATRVPASLVQQLKIHCVEREISAMQFVAEALREKLRRAGVRPVK